MPCASGLPLLRRASFCAVALPPSTRVTLASAATLCCVLRSRIAEVVDTRGVHNKWFWKARAIRASASTLSIDDIAGRRYHAAMASILIRNLDDTVAKRLRLQARLKGVPIEQEARRILAEGTRVTRQDMLAVARAIRARQKLHKSRAEDLIREDRDR